MTEAQKFLFDAVLCSWYGTLRAMNDAVQMTADKGPAAAVEFIADYLDNTDAMREPDLPADWLTRWNVALNTSRTNEGSA